MAAIRHLNGLGLVAAGERNILPGTEYDKLFPAPKKTDPLLTSYGDTFDTVKYMEEIVKNSLDETAKIAKVLKAESLEKTLRNIFKFVYRHIRYKLDSPTEEELRSPARLWADRQTGGDCDCYSIFISSILTNLGIEHAFRKTKYNGRPYYQHIYIVVPKKPGLSLERRENYWTLDPVLDSFDDEKTFSQKFDKRMMPIRHLNGLGYLGSTVEEDKFEPGLYYAPEAEKYTREDGVIFWDGLNGYYVLADNTGLNGLGFLKKLWSGIKKVGSKVWNGVKKVVKVAAPIATSLIPGGGVVSTLAKGAINLISSGGSKSPAPVAKPQINPAMAASAAFMPGVGPMMQVATQGAAKQMNSYNTSNGLNIDTGNILNQLMPRLQEQFPDSKFVKAFAKTFSQDSKQKEEELNALKQELAILKTKMTLKEEQPVTNPNGGFDNTLLYLFGGFFAFKMLQSA